MSTVIPPGAKEWPFEVFLDIELNAIKLVAAEHGVTAELTRIYVLDKGSEYFLVFGRGDFEQTLQVHVQVLEAKKMELEYS